MVVVFGLIKEVYKSYLNDRESHVARIAIQIIVSVTIGGFGTKVSEVPFTVMSLAISVLTGFSFTALFSEPSTRMVDLPPAEDETDRVDLGRLKQMGINFRVRARYFIVLAVLELLLMISAVVQIGVSREALLPLLGDDSTRTVFDTISMTRSVLHRLIIGLVFIVFFEWVYTFYRLSETILSILKVRSDYIESKAGRS